MNWLDIAGTIIGLVYIYQEYKASIWLWVTGLIMPMVYMFVYYEAGLYADFGMQVNILNRYGIKNYAVPGRDYRFENGDTTDFRRENLIILNRYHGVSYEKEKGLYLSKIHVRGNYVIGRYTTMEEAAIAYNKAVDICLLYTSDAADD